MAEERQREFERVVEGSEEMITAVDREYRYLSANNQFLTMRKMTREQVVGHFANEVLNKVFLRPSLSQSWMSVSKVRSSNTRRNIRTLRLEKGTF